MGYKVLWHEKAVEDLRGIDKEFSSRIVERVKNYLSREPLSLGKPLKGMFKGLYRYRFGSYRIIYAVDMAQKTLSVLRVGHRKKIYD